LVKVIKVDPKRFELEHLKEAVEAVKSSGLVIYPTDTVYGLGADPYAERAVIKVFKLKRRELRKPLPVLTSSPAKARKLVKFNEVAEVLAERFWPGPLTLILPLKDKKIPSCVHAGSGKLGIRVPNHEIALRLTEGVGGYLVGTSANISGAPPPTTLEEALSYFKDAGEDVVAIDGGPTPLKAPSTVIDLTDVKPKIVREGSLSVELINAALRGLGIDGE